MLYSIQHKKYSTSLIALFILALFSFSSCMPTATGPSVDAGKSVDNPDSDKTNTDYSEPEMPFPNLFVQEGTQQSSTNLTIPLNFTDSFLIRGKALSEFLRTVPNTTKFCVAAKYNNVPGSDRFLIMSAKPKSFTDLIQKTTEFYLYVEPSNEVANKNDCISYNLTNALYAGSVSPSLHFSLLDLCSNCTTTVTSSPMKLFYINGESVPNTTGNSIRLTISRSSTGSSNGCMENTTCKANGYDCCLQSQCVKDGAERPGATSLPGYSAAKEDVDNNPSRFVLYPQYFFVCESRPENGGSNPTPNPGNPDYEAAIRLMELKQLYSCLNQVDSEFSYCTLKYPQANKSMPGRFSAANDDYYDDINFTTVNPHLGTSDKKYNISKIVYGGQTVYEEGKTHLSGVVFDNPTVNDNLNAALAVDLNLTLPTNALDANLYITYKVDGTCERMNADMAKCVKTFIHGSSDKSSTKWHDLTKVYKLPPYADTSATSSIIVRVSGVVVPEGPTTWRKTTSPIGIEFLAYDLYPNQTVEITYFVKNNAARLTKLRSDAQDKVNSMCNCAVGSKCNLKPLYDNDGTTIVNFECRHPTTEGTTPPVNQTVYVSNKNVAHRYYDKHGVNYDDDWGSADEQELKPFSYTSNNVLKPNNVSQYVGFNEIYGSFAKSGQYVAKPAKMVRVKKDTFYDIIVNSGSFSSCLNCGSDYYNSLQKIFPQNFSGQGGGYAPDNYASQRQSNSSIYRGDDLLFGRACFVPATMIPWTHSAGENPIEQRRGRLAAQHFLFANGYNRDWYGFDYGSLIGSFDGVTWFSIGNQRRIKANSSKLFLAVNAYLGDLNVDGNFNVLVSETTPYSSDIPDHDTETDGAQCQRSHFCSNDNDCFRQLGYDYSCQNVASLTTSWPVFDASGTEVVGSNVRTLLSLAGGSNGQNKRCVYRGRGAPCVANLNTATPLNSFNGTNTVGHIMCSPNNSCVDVNTANKFNDRIARFATTPVSQNAGNAAPTKTDTVGLGARIILRPFDYYGKQSTPPDAKPNLVANKLNAVCIPGKDLASTTNTTFSYDTNNRHPSDTTDSSDKIFGVGPTLPGTSERALSMCPATDAAGTDIHSFNLQLGNPTLQMFTISQNLSSNLLDLPALVAQKIFSVTNDGNPVTTVGYQRNACLRAPGASCFSDMECAPSGVIASKARAAGLSSVLNEAEAKFWEEELVCGNPDFKYVAPGILNSTFDPKKNKCCRDIGKTISVYTQKDDSSFQWCDEATDTVTIAGKNVPLNSPSRYSRIHTVYDKMTCNRNEISSTKTFALSVTGPTATERMQQILGQYKTLDALNQRACCTNNWVRSFSTENGAGHAFSKNKMQKIDREMFKHISWGTDMDHVIFGSNVDAPFECAAPYILNDSCEIKNLSPSEEEKYLTWASTLELVGIPQVAIKANDQIYKLVNDSQIDISASLEPLTDSNGKAILQKNAAPDFQDMQGNYYSAANYTKMNMGTNPINNSLKKVFSENEFNCCIPAGVEVPSTTTSSQCCTGYSPTGETQKRCCLPDFTDVTVYLNRYVSSEGSGLPDSAYDPATGYIKDPAQVKLIASQKRLCCSGRLMTGVAISQLPIPLTGNTYNPPDSTNTTRRFAYRTDGFDNAPETGSISSLFDAGVRWNNHVYCVPEGLAP